MASPTYPLRTKVIVVVVLTLAVGAFALAVTTADTGNGDAAIIGGAPGESTENSEGIEGIVPARDAEVLSQQSFGVDLASGWTAELTLLPPDGGAIPIPSASVTPNSLNEIVFQPGEGKAIASLPSGLNCVRVVAWSLSEGRAASERTESWCFDVT